MKVLLCLCTLVAASSAGLIGYPVAPVAYPGYTYTSVISPPLTTVARPFGVTYTGLHGHPFALAPSYFSYNLIPNNVVFTGVPGVVHYLPVAPPGGKGKPDKKPGDKKDDKDKGTKEETTEEPKTEEGAESKPTETEDLAQ